VKAFTANNTEETVRLNQLHKDCHQRVRYKKVCPEHGELKSSEIVSGYEFAPEEYVVIDPQELNKLRPESDKAVKIEGFVAPAEIDGVYLAGKTYYLLPDGIAGDKPYALLHKGMQDRGVVAIAWVVISGREQLVMLRPAQDMLAICVLHTAKKIKDIAPLQEELADLEVTAEEVKLTDTLINASTIQEFDFDVYEDMYTARLTELIRAKIDGKEIVQAPDVEEPKILNLMEALKASVAEAQASSGAGSGKKAAKKTSSAKAAPSAGAKKKDAARKKSG
jgi:DNA end-binding protein Ku